ncbi:chromatin associated protein KTI12 [Kalaharituber pfeilii]|nr:chromatin associated protein KTI12 [Kalaharituber pfeilii]
MITGFPCAGETTRALQLRDYFIYKIAAAQLARIARLKIHLITIDNACSEKEAQVTEYSAIKRYLSKDYIVIVDSLSSVESYRYQLYCEAKAGFTPSCVVKVHVGTPEDLCRKWNNERRERNAAGNKSYFRYEEPNDMNRWDSPLFTAPYDAIVGKRVIVRPNQVTIVKPILDKTTQEIVNLILDARKNSIVGGELKVLECSEVFIELPPSVVTLPQLQRIRRQYISLNRQHTQAKSRIRELFVNYLNQNLD